MTLLVRYRDQEDSVLIPVTPGLGPPGTRWGPRDDSSCHPQSSLAAGGRQSLVFSPWVMWWGVESLCHLPVVIVTGSGQSLSADPVTQTRAGQTCGQTRD